MLTNSDKIQNITWSQSARCENPRHKRSDTLRLVAPKPKPHSRDASVTPHQTTSVTPGTWAVKRSPHVETIKKILQISFMIFFKRFQKRGKKHSTKSTHLVKVL